MWAAAVNSRGGANLRVSCKTLVIPPPEPVDISAVSSRVEVFFSKNADLSAAPGENKRAVRGGAAGGVANGTAHGWRGTTTDEHRKIGDRKIAQSPIRSTPV